MSAPMMQKWRPERTEGAERSEDISGDNRLSCKENFERMLPGHDGTGKVVYDEARTGTAATGGPEDTGTSSAGLHRRPAVA